ncbi:hypothetical protein L6R52_44120 [Myxococcota bacterium]|nr:hypothetical protein [Myxococcota bacterium]
MPTSTGARRASTHVALVAAAALCGCGELLDDRADLPPLATLKGFVRADGSAGLTNELGLALLWFPTLLLGEEPPSGLPGPDDVEPCTGAPAPRTVTTATVTYVAFEAQAVPFRPLFPLRFELEIDELPPASAMIDLAPYGGEGHVAAGLVVAFEDLDHNGRYDRGRPGVEGDRFLASSATNEGEQLVLFLDGPSDAPRQLFGGPEDGGLSGPIPPGLSIVRYRGTLGSAELLPIDTDLELEIDGVVEDYEQVLFACERIEYTIIQDGPPPEDAEYNCSPDGREWWTNALTPLEACRSVSFDTHACIPPEAPAPEGWPCPIFP